jgi:aldehyde dehydrogenase (NAD+)
MSSRILEIFEKQKAKARELRNSTDKQRLQKIQKLKEIVESKTKALEEAMWKDFRKNPQEVHLTEVVPFLMEANEFIRNLSYWMKPKEVSTPIALVSSFSYIQYEPYGNVLILSPWNYPFQLAMVPLVGCIGAGNTVILKPSELTENTSLVIQEIVELAFPEEEVAVLQGDAELASKLLDLPFHHIFFTGSTRVGKIVMEKAAKNLAHVTLELGGKSPVIIGSKIELKYCAEKIAWGKFLNAGQTCIAPDYVLLPKEKHEEFANLIKEFTEKFYLQNSKSYLESSDYCRIINQKNFSRLNHLLKEALEKGAKFSLGGKVYPEEKIIEPTILTHVPKDALIMQEEVFGPILPIVDSESIEESIEFIASREKPLALYVFSNYEKEIKKIITQTSSGGVVINDVLLHFINHNLPFGGVNHSGMGSYHGFHSFANFSHKKAILKQGMFNPMRFVYPPYTEVVEKFSEFLKKFLI